jgi:hypothetical protein
MIRLSIRVPSFDEKRMPRRARHCHACPRRHALRPERQLVTRTTRENGCRRGYPPVVKFQPAATFHPAAHPDRFDLQPTLSAATTMPALALSCTKRFVISSVSFARSATARSHSTATSAPSNRASLFYESTRVSIFAANGDGAIRW